MYEKTIGNCCVSYGLFIYHSKKSHIQRDIGTKLDKNHCFNCYRCLPIPFLRIRTHTQLQECFSVSLIQRVKEKVHLPRTDIGLVRNWRRFFQTMKNIINSLVKIVWEMNLDIFGVNSHIKTCLGIKNYVWDPNSDVENENITTNFSWQI